MARRLALALACICAALPGATIHSVYAQTSTSNSNSNSNANATTNAGSAATSMAGTSSAVVNQFQNNPSHTDATIHNAPPIGSIGLFGGTNPCTAGAAGAVSVVGVGVGFGGQWSARACERRNVAVILFQANMPDVAVAVLCQDHDIRNAFRASGRPCPQDVRRTPEAPAPVAAATPAVRVATTAAPAPSVAQPPARAMAATEPAALGMTAAPAGGSAPTGATYQPASATIDIASNMAEPLRYRGPTPAWCNQQPATPGGRAAYDYYCH